MSNELRIDIEGTLNNLSLSEKKGLLPLYEAIINSIQAISDSINKDKGFVNIQVIRDNDIQKQLDDSDSLGKISGFIIQDNGIGFDSSNYNSFKTAYSTFKKTKGCKGIGRFLWLKAFESIKISSTYMQDDGWKTRKFIFSTQGVSSEREENSVSHELFTEVKLEGLKEKYQASIPSSIEEIAKKIVINCLLFFIYQDSCPQITLHDEENIDCPSIDLNKYFTDNIKDSLHQDVFNIKDYEFRIYHLRMINGVSSHLLHLCANMYDVTAINLKNRIPDLKSRICTSDMPDGFYYCGYITSDYLDSIVNSSRTKLEFYEQDEQDSLFEPNKNEIVNAAVESIKSYLSDYIDGIQKNKVERINTYVKLDHPTYRYLLSQKPQVYNEIPANLTDDELELELHKHVQKWEREIKEKGIALDKQIKSSDDSSRIMDRFEEYWSNVTELSKTCLAEYVTRRKALLSILESALTKDDNGKFRKEEVVHSLICPMRHTSDDVAFEEMNLWVIDERLAYHYFLASDRTIKSIPFIESKSTKEPDIAIFDKAFAFVDSDEPFNSVTIIEFKKPDYDYKDPIMQVGKYIDLIKDGKSKKANGRVFHTNDGTLFRCYIICDLTPKMKEYCIEHDFILTPDNMGYTGSNRSRNAYYEVISYDKLVGDAKKRNQIFFDKLFSPSIETIIHMPDVK